MDRILPREGERQDQELGQLLSPAAPRTDRLSEGMDPLIREFYKQQYKWQRLPHPDIRVADSRKHPLHHIELEISHSIHLVQRLIRGILEGKNQVTHRDAIQAIEKFAEIRFALEISEETPSTDRYKHFVDETLDLLKNGAAILQGSP
ncbi:hypothetical protein [Deinococcus aluminii]|uniref:hypothetical protein n=1 Tax=Deinococcus aluminii TaxID=1656885 RepID=UPI0031E62EF8